MNRIATALFIVAGLLSRRSGTPGATGNSAAKKAFP